jgi:hypothetical protein
MNRLKPLLSIFIILLFITFSGCAKPQSAEEKAKEDQELEQVDKTLKSDQERADSMKKALQITD